jgi:hypothetical protein
LFYLFGSFVWLGAGGNWLICERLLRPLLSHRAVCCVCISASVYNVSCCHFVRLFLSLSLLFETSYSDVNNSTTTTTTTENSSAPIAHRPVYPNSLHTTRWGEGKKKNNTRKRNEFTVDLSVCFVCINNQIIN